MKEHPIIFSTSMVQAIMEGRKTMTRRIIKPQPSIDDFYAQVGSSNGVPAINDYDSKRVIKCPFGQPGNLLWVRESFFWCPDDNELEGTNTRFFYKSALHESNYEWMKEKGYKWKPSIYMPKAAARIWLKVVNVRVERLQDISNDDAKAEGVELLMPQHLYKNYNTNTEPKKGFTFPFSSFESLWRKIHGGESWNENPWVWVVELERVDRVQADA